MHTVDEVLELVRNQRQAEAAGRRDRRRSDRSPRRCRRTCTTTTHTRDASVRKLIRVPGLAIALPFATPGRSKTAPPWPIVAYVRTPCNGSPGCPGKSSCSRRPRVTLPLRRRRKERLRAGPRLPRRRAQLVCPGVPGDASAGLYGLEGALVEAVSG
jgi:hypothetical protein